MKIYIEQTDLNLLLEKKKQFIGKKVVWDSVLSAVSFLVSVGLATYNDLLGIPGIVLKTVFVILGLFFTAKSIYDIFISKKNSYSHEDLYQDINKLNSITHNHSLAIIKNTFEEYANKYLVYDDLRWGCRFFPNYKTNENNESFILSHISSELKVDKDKLKIQFVCQEVHEKYAESHGENRIYCHRLYMVTINDFPEAMKHDEFEYDGRTYHWMSIPEMEQDPIIMKKNADVVSFVKNNCK